MVDIYGARSISLSNSVVISHLVDLVLKLCVLEGSIVQISFQKKERLTSEDEKTFLSDRKCLPIVSSKIFNLINLFTTTVPEFIYIRLMFGLINLPM